MSSNYPQVLLQNRKPDRIATLDEYRQSGGYQALTDVLKDFSHKDVQEAIMDSNLLGRGGAAFPTAMKLMSVADDAGFPRYIICNADEMEPGTFKDRVLLHADPHMVIEGIIIAGYASQAAHGIIFIRPEYENAARILEREIELAKQEGYLGNHILGSNYSLELIVHRSAGRYICGEVTALMNALMGKRPNPMKPPPYPTEKGLWGKPTVLSNVETFACIPHIIRNGGQWFKDLAKTENGAGTKIFCISGKVNKPACYELPVGVRLSEIIESYAGGMTAGSEFKACLPGGASTGFLPREHYDIEMDFDALKSVGNRLGTGAIMVFDHQTCLVAATVNLIEFFARESCGWCTPCREGLPYILDILKRIEAGDGEAEHIPMLEDLCKSLWNAYCAFAPGAVAPVESLLWHFKDEVEEHIEQKRCPFRQ
ncbi:MAG: NADH-ubiquinone oxidoreductase-F iron-sulfur binding region domain-containing protein [Desulfobacterales bacterium]|nr:NADH-ubiquinone oxidoreductase-F iron-sulfur binding region domain-containing protein [Desulfobacterales bacterium]